MQDAKARDVWERALGALQVQVTRSVYDTWLADSTGLEYQGETFVIGARSAFSAEWLERRMMPLMQRTLMEILKHPVTATVRVADVAPTSEALIGHAPSAAATAVAAEPQAPPKVNPRFTFNSFVVGDNNRLAYSAALAVAQAPGESYNPLYIHADVGLGKTHLLQAISHSAAVSGHSTLMVSSEQFVTDFVTSVRERQDSGFKEKYRAPDVLLVDDIQFLSGKTQSEESFFHLFNSLYETERQIIITSDCPPAALPNVQRRLTSRFQWGLEVEVTMPPEETRFAILKEKASKAPIDVDESVLAFIASREITSVRALEGSLNKVVAHAAMTQEAPTVESAQMALGSSTTREMRGASRVSQRDIAERTVIAVCEYYGLSQKVLTGASRESRYSVARQMTMYLLHHEVSLSFKEISAYVGDRHPKTIQHGVLKIEETQASDARLTGDLESLRAKLFAA